MQPVRFVPRKSKAESVAAGVSAAFNISQMVARRFVAGLYGHASWSDMLRAIEHEAHSTPAEALPAEKNNSRDKAAAHFFCVQPVHQPCGCGGGGPPR